jgi:hypothetical protein
MNNMLRSPAAPSLHLADHPALQAGERLVEERRPRLSRGVWRAGEGAVRLSPGKTAFYRRILPPSQSPRSRRAHHLT